MDNNSGYFSPFGKYNGNEIFYLEKVLNSEKSLDNERNPSVSLFEEEFCKLTGAKYAVALNSATSALHAALIAAEVGPGDEVIQPAITVVMNSFVTIIAGATPVFCEVNKDTWNIDATDIEKLITPKTKAIMPVSLFGLPVDLDPIMELASKHNLIVIDDSAETLCGIYKKKWAGLKADMSIYSFENKKHMTSGSEGGMLITMNADLATKVRKFAGLGYKNLTATAGRTSLASSEFQRPSYERHDFIGLNYRMNAITAAVGLAQLERIDHLVQRRICIGNMFLRAINNCNWLIPQTVSNDMNHTYYTFGVRYLGEKYFGISWESFYQMYTKRGGDGFYAAWVNPYLEPALKGSVFSNQTCENGLCSLAETYQKQIMLFKTNYRDLGDARRNVEILEELINELEK